MNMRATVILGLLVMTVAGGCSGQPETHLVHGMVVYPDGKPVKRGTVEFETMRGDSPITASAEIEADGTFQLGTFEQKDGAIVGTHRVAVIADFEVGTGAERPGLIPPPRLDPKYRSFATSGLEFEIKPETNNILVEVDYAPPPDSEESPATIEAPGE